MSFFKKLKNIGKSLLGMETDQEKEARRRSEQLMAEQQVQRAAYENSVREQQKLQSQATVDNVVKVEVGGTANAVTDALNTTAKKKRAGTASSLGIM